MSRLFDASPASKPAHLDLDPAQAQDLACRFQGGQEFTNWIGKNMAQIKGSEITMVENGSRPAAHHPIMQWAQVFKDEFAPGEGLILLAKGTEKKVTTKDPNRPIAVLKKVGFVPQNSVKKIFGFFFEQQSVEVR